MFNSKFTGADFRFRFSTKLNWLAGKIVSEMTCFLCKVDVYVNPFLLSDAYYAAFFSAYQVITRLLIAFSLNNICHHFIGQIQLHFCTGTVRTSDKPDAASMLWYCSLMTERSSDLQKLCYNYYIFKGSVWEEPEYLQRILLEQTLCVCVCHSPVGSPYTVLHV